MKKTTAKKSNTGKKVAIGLGVAAIGAGAYYLLGPDGKKNQKKIAAFASKIKKEAEQKIKEVKNATEPAYHKVIDTLSKKYGTDYKEHKNEISAIAKALKSSWKDIKNSAKKPSKK